MGNLRWAFNNGTRFARNFHDSLLDIFFLHTLGMDHEAFLLYTLTNFSKSLLFYAIRILRGAFRLPRGNARKYPTPPLRIRVDTSRAKASSRVVNVFISTLNVDYIRGCVTYTALIYQKSKAYFILKRSMRSKSINLIGLLVRRSRSEQNNIISRDPYFEQQLISFTRIKVETMQDEGRICFELNQPYLVVSTKRYYYARNTPLLYAGNVDHSSPHVSYQPLISY